MANTKGRILIIDDEPGIRNFLGEILEAEGYCVLSAQNGDEGLRMIQEHDLNLVFLDLRFPYGLDGIDVLKEALRLKPSIQIVIITGHGKIKDAVEATRLGAYDFVEKPLDQERMIVLARRAIEKDSLQKELDTLKREAQQKYQMIGDSPAIQKVYRLIEKAAPAKAKVLILGESGAGKELVAHAIHYLSPRAGKPFQKLNCAALPTELIESELFGIEKGIATGVDQHIGKFERADGGTLLLDEIGDMTLMTQAKVLRVLQDGEIQRVGDTKEFNVDVRVIAATRKDLKSEIEEGNFREDLFFRLSVITIQVPPLRERREDIPLLLDHYLKHYCDENNVPLKRFSPDALTYLSEQPWKGNVRQLKSLVEKLVVLTETEDIRRHDVIPALEHTLPAGSSRHVETLKEARLRFEREYIRNVLRANGENVTKTAEDLGLERTNLYRKMKQLGIATKGESSRLSDSP
jgi:two-component system nitrogen regulation response regulator NtrX